MLIIKSCDLMVLGVISAFLHEAGHLFMMKIKGHKIAEINIGFFNVDIVDRDRDFASFTDKFLILISGSLFNFIICAVSLIFLYFTAFPPFKSAVYVNFAIGTLNLLPISSLDGGQIFYNLAVRFFPLRAANIICTAVSLIFLFPLSVVGFLTLLNSKYNFSLLFICLYLIYVLLAKKETQYL